MFRVPVLVVTPSINFNMGCIETHLLCNNVLHDERLTLTWDVLKLNTVNHNVVEVID